MNIEAIEICRPWTAISSSLESALDFSEGSHAGTQVEIRREQIPLEKITVLVFGTCAEAGLVQ